MIYTFRENVETAVEDVDLYSTITITFTNGDNVIWQAPDWTDYKYDGKFFIVINEGAWVGLYNLNNIIAVEVE